MKKAWLFALLLLLGFCAEAQWNRIGIVTFGVPVPTGGNVITLERIGRSQIYYCSDASPYNEGHFGIDSVGSFQWNFCAPVDSIKLNLTTLQVGDDVTIYINDTVVKFTDSTKVKLSDYELATCFESFRTLVKQDTILYMDSPGIKSCINIRLKPGTPIHKLRIQSLGGSEGVSHDLWFGGGDPIDTIAGPDHVCVDKTITLTNSTPGGIWTSSDTVAFIDSITGVVTGHVPGVTTITYTLGPGCYLTKRITVYGKPYTTWGVMDVCVGKTTIMRGYTSDGEWSSGDPSIATITSRPDTGIVTGVSAGTAIITYSSPGGCFVTDTITVHPSPAPIVGDSALCSISTTTLTDSTPGGVWTSSNTGVVTVGSLSGIVTRGSRGTAVITYTLPTGCYTTHTITTNPSEITGIFSLCVGATETLSSLGGSGVWISGSSGVATIGSSTGIVTGVSAGTTIITYLVSGGCFALATVTVNPLPAAITGPTEVCTGSTITLSDATPDGIWISGNLSVATIGSTTGILTGVSIGTTVITYVLPTGCSITTTILVNPTPSPITGITTLCAGATTTLSSSTSGGTWNSSNTGVATIGSGTGIVTGVNSGVSTITYMMPTGCYVTTTVTVNPTPGLTPLSPKICIGSSLTMGRGLLGGGTWSSSNTGVATVGSTGVVTSVSIGTTIISYILPTGCYGTRTVTVHPLPEAITGTFTVCAGHTATLADATSGGTWSSSDAGVATIDATSGVWMGVSAGTATITYKITATTCYAVAVVTVNPTPEPIEGILYVCVGQTTVLTSPTPGGTWSSDFDPIATVGSTSGIVSGIAAGIVDISYSFSTGCYATASFTVNPMPGAIGGPASVCLHSSITLSNAYSGGIWTSSNTGVATIGSVSGEVWGVGIGTSIITYTMPGDCFVTKTITVNPTPDNIIQPNDMCVGDMVVWTDATPGGTWSTSNIAVGTFSGDVLTGVSAGTLTVTYMLSTGCFVTATLTVNPAAVFSGPYSVCLGATATLTGTPSGGTWISSGPAIAPVGSSTGIVTGVGVGVVNITYVLPTGCISYHTFTVNPNPDIIGGTEVCYTSTILLTSSMGGGSWSSSDEAVATVGSTSGVVTGGMGGTAIITYTLPTGCFATHTVNVPGPSAIAEPLYVCVGATTTLSCTPLGGTWSAGSTTILTIGSTTGIVTGVTAGTATITYIVTLAPDCLGMAIATFTVAPIPVLHPNRAKVWCGGSTQLDANGPTGGSVSTPYATYTWSPSTGLSATTGGTVYFVGPMPPGSMIVYTITCTTMFGCVTTALDTVFTLCDSLSCQALSGGAITPIGDTIGAPGVTTVLPPGGYYAYSNIVFRGTVVMNGAIVTILPGVRMVIHADSRLLIESSHLFCCSRTQLWKGIYLGSNLTSQSASCHITKQSLIEDAEAAVNIVDGVISPSGWDTLYQDTSLFTSDGVIYNRNIIAINILRFPSPLSTLPPVPTKYPFKIWNSVFTSRDLSNFSGGSHPYPAEWPATDGTTTCMKYNTSWMPASLLLPPFNVDNPDAAGAGIRYRGVPCKDGTQADIGISLRYVGGYATTGGSAATSYSEIAIGDSAEAVDRPALNLFDTLHSGINAQFSNFTSVNNAFIHMYPQDTARTLGAGIIASALTTIPLPGTLAVNRYCRMQVVSSNPGAATGLLTNNLFYDCQNGVWSKDYYEVKGSGSEMYSNHGYAGTWYRSGSFGYDISSGRYSNIEIKHNTLNNIWRTGIFLRMTASSIAAGLEGNAVVTKNTINSEISGAYPPDSQYVKQGILVSNAAGPRVYSTRGEINVDKNLLNYVYNGIKVEGFLLQKATSDSNFANMKIDRTLYHPVFRPSLQQYGIEHAGCNKNQMLDNLVVGPGADSPRVTFDLYPIPGSDCAIVAYFGAQNTDALISCNYADSTTAGFQFFGSSNISTWKNNSMVRNGYGYVLNGRIGPQGSRWANPSDNEWVALSPHWNDTGLIIPRHYQTLTINGLLGPTNPNLSPLRVRDISVGMSTFSPCINWSSPVYIVGNTYGAGFCQGNGIDTFVSTAPRPECQHQWEAWELMPVYHPIAKADLGTTSYADYWMAQKGLYDIIAADSALRDSSDTLHQFWIMSATSRYKWLNDIENALAAEDSATAATLLAFGIDSLVNISHDSVTNVQMADDAHADTVVKHYIDYYKLYLRHMTGTLSHADSCEVTYMASLCPNKDGSIIYQVRGLYRILYDDPGAFNDNCSDSGGASGLCDTCGWLGRYANSDHGNTKKPVNQIATHSYNLLPNPNNGSFVITRSGSDEEAAAITIIDGVGREVYKQAARFNAGRTQLELGNVPSGLYLMRIKDATGRFYQIKFVVAK